MKSGFYFTIIIASIALLASCTKTLEKEPLERITDELAFDNIDKNADYAKQFLYGTYLQLPDGYNRVSGAFLDAGTDDAVHSQDGNVTESYRNGRITALNVVDNQWGRNYTGIRRVNIFLSKIDGVPGDPVLLTQWKAEARFLRAYFYYELIKRWGGVPLLGNKVFGLEDNLNLQRNSLEECIAYILSEIEAIKPDLLPAVILDKDLGRANLGAALALKSRVTLFAASPLVNTSNNVQKWEEAAAAAKEVIQLKAYSLSTDFIAMFNATKNAEIIFSVQKAQSQVIESNNGPVGFISGAGRTSPSQNLVDAFLMKNGKRISESGSGYNAATPYANRDNRFDASIIYNGKNWLNRPIETFEGGLDKPGGNRIQTKTGYYLRKFMGKFETSANYSNQNHHVILFRYAEILLNYAEALNEASGPVEDVLTAMKDIRKRAGITAGAGNLFGLSTTATKEEMRELIRNERRIELAFEEHRFWDIRRWKIAENVISQPIKGMNIVKDANGVLTYNITDVVPSVFDATKMYWFPIPFSEIQTNPNMTQNPGWSY